MATFKQVPQTFLLQKCITFWGNFVKNYEDDIQNDGFFSILRECCDHDKAVELIETAYTLDELKEMEVNGVRWRRNRLDLDDPLDDVFMVLWNHSARRSKCRIVLQALQEYMLAKCVKPKNDDIEKRFVELKRVLKLSDLELEVLILAYVQNQTCFEWPLRISDHTKPLYFAMALNRAYTEIQRVMNAKCKLLKFKLLDNDWDFNGRTIGGYIDGVESETLERRFYKKNEQVEVLPWSFYGELATKDGAILKNMLATKPKKCNILFYGVPGTGKTSFAHTLAHELGRTAWEIKQGDDDGKNMGSTARMMGIQICNDQESADESLMIVDEADELLRANISFEGMIFGGNVGGKSTEKGVMNSILDEMKMPAVWISNTSAWEMDESVRRRFDYSICFEELTNAQRISIWQNLIGKHQLGKLISEDQIADYAVKYTTSAGGISLVLENLKRLKPSKAHVDEVVEKLMKPHCKLMCVEGTKDFLPAKDYSLEGLNIKGKVSLEKVTTAIRHYLDQSFNAASEDKPRMNLLMFGPPGTGKSEFVKYLGKELDRKILVMKGSDILSKYVGEAEANIARAFRRAENEHAILFFDEIDGLIQSREMAHASWEVSQVNELLQQMENFQGVMIAATNFCKNLDPAIMRRFTFKLEFGYLDDAGKKLFFERFFKTTLSAAEEEDLKGLKNLTPGDFRTVRQEQFYLGEMQTNEDRIGALKEECRLKRDGAPTTPIGF